jgi:hypothetical protein
LHPVEQFSYRPGAPPPRADDALADLICGYLRKCQADLARNAEAPTAAVAKSVF